LKGAPILASTGIAGRQLVGSFADSGHPLRKRRIQSERKKSENKQGFGKCKGQVLSGKLAKRVAVLRTGKD